ncbi:MAG: TIGR00730 family Rossman fold protein [Paracoccaceae bacterium]
MSAMTVQGISVCLFCGSRSGTNPVFIEAARELGRGLAMRGHQLVYGAGDRGLMGEAARASQAAGGKVVGVIPQHLVDAEVGKSDLDEYLVVDNMHQRKMLMFERSNAVVTLPGGPGTLDELIEVLTWRQLGLHTRPVMLVNSDGYWEPLLGLVDHLIETGFADGSFRDLITVVPDARSAIEQIELQLDLN